jgi:hypothetical protein
MILTVSHFRGGALLVALALLSAIAGCKGGERASVIQRPTGQAPSAAAAPTSEGAIVHFSVKGEPLAEGVVVGDAKTFGNLTVFPILAKSQLDVGPLISLHEGLKKGLAEVRELGTEGGEGPVAQRSGGAQVGTLVIENRGRVPVYVLAGTIVKGGNQDRQIGQDFIIGASETVPIDAFCVEHGRWNGEREGRLTSGKFEAVDQLANTEVRVAGQYKSDQGEVWSKVSAVNRANDKSSGTDSLLASADDPALKHERSALAGEVLTHLAGIEPRGAVVGYAYAIDGQVKAVRWFAHHRIYGLFREVLVNTSVMDAMTARAAGTKASGPPATPQRVAAFVTEANQAAESTVKETAAENTNEYAESPKAYRSTTKLKSPAKGGPKKPMSVDYTAK